MLSVIHDAYVFIQSAPHPVGQQDSPKEGI